MKDNKYNWLQHRIKLIASSSLLTKILFGFSGWFVPACGRQVYQISRLINATTHTQTRKPFKNTKLK